MIREQIKAIETGRRQRLKGAPRKGTHPMLHMLARIMGIGIETADMLVHEVLSRKHRGQRALARYGGLIGTPDESGSKRREKGSLARAMHGCGAAWPNWPGAGSCSRTAAS